ncbi:hypothetical protein NW755_013914 [Fusarium falciforme]|uniref:BZIP domain-containing protein n=1 Tax=Fusarium falciforme TaxID=195108 RepID=A0A9W8QV81_9HYPO|nr:hypothetical protein NW755_013914 [Fusarium falciforme]
MEEQAPKTPARDDQGRAEKKRQTDRIAQQKHRKRQREHIAQLEKQLQVIQQGGESEIAQLVSENAKLREEMQQLYELVDRLQEVVQIGSEIKSRFEARRKDHHQSPGQEWALQHGSGPSEQLVVDDRATLDVDTETLGASEVMPATGMPNSSTEHVLGNIDMILPDITTGNDTHLESTSGVSIVSSTGSSSDNSLWSHGSAVHVLDPVANWWLDPHHDTSGARVQRPLMASSYPDPDICKTDVCTAEWEEFHTDDSGVQPGDGASNREQVFRTSRTTPAGIKGLYTGSLASVFSVHPCSKLPCFISPSPPRDAEMHRILNIARSQIYDIGPPTFTDFLLSNPKNTLSIELKVFTEPMRLMKKSSEFLAAYWILYLLFRWQATLDEKSYHALPTWLRPTPLQLEVEHHAVLDQVPW